MDELPDVLTTREIADRERVDHSTVCFWVRTGRLPAYKLGDNGVWRIRREDYLAFRQPNTPAVAPASAGPAVPMPVHRPGRSRQKAAAKVLAQAGIDRGPA